MREIESLLIAAQNIAIRTGYIKEKIDNTQWNNKGTFCGDRDKTIKHIISEYSKLTQKEYQTRHNWVGKLVRWELCKKLKFDHTTKWQTHKLESVQENEAHKIIWDFEIQTDHLFLARKPDQVIIEKKKK